MEQRIGEVSNRWTETVWEPKITAKSKGEAYLSITARTIAVGGLVNSEDTHNTKTIIVKDKEEENAIDLYSTISKNISQNKENGGLKEISYIEQAKNTENIYKTEPQYFFACLGLIGEDGGKNLSKDGILLFQKKIDALNKITGSVTIEKGNIDDTLEKNLITQEDVEKFKTYQTRFAEYDEIYNKMHIKKFNLSEEKKKEYIDNNRKYVIDAYSKLLKLYKDTKGNTEKWFTKKLDILQNAKANSDIIRNAKETGEMEGVEKALKELTQASKASDEIDTETKKTGEKLSSIRNKAVRMLQGIPRRNS